MTQDKPIIDDDRIRERAHQLWVERGCPIGAEQEDWYRAEQLLQEEALAQGEPVPDSQERATETRAVAEAAANGRPKKARARKR